MKWVFKGSSGRGCSKGVEGALEDPLKRDALLTVSSADLLNPRLRELREAIY